MERWFGAIRTNVPRGKGADVRLGRTAEGDMLVELTILLVHLMDDF
jgi:hypothetical protein